MPRMRLPSCLAATCFAAATSLSATAETVTVTLTGQVEWSFFSSGPLGGVDPGDLATCTFTVDSEVFTNSPNFPTRGYPISKPSFVFSFSNGASVGLKSPFPVNQTPYFVLRNNDPQVDGFFVSTNVDNFGALPLQLSGNNGMAWHITLPGTTFPSLDILDALGTYTINQISVFNWTITNGPSDPMGIVWDKATLTVPAACPADLDGNGDVGGPDLAILLADWGPCKSCAADLDDDGQVSATDLAILLSAWGPCG